MSDVRSKLEGVSVATLTTALFKRGFRNQVIAGVRPLPGGPVRVVGPAFTVRTIPAREDKATAAVLADRNYPQRAAIEAAPAGSVLVMDSRQDARAASGGDILMARLQARGVAGFITDGGMRDCPDIAALNFPVFQSAPAPSISLTHHLAVDTQVPIACGGVAVFPGDMIVGDADGLVVIPAEITDDVAEEAAEMTSYEAFVLDEVKGGASIFGLYPATDESRQRYQDWKSRAKS